MGLKIFDEKEYDAHGDMVVQKLDKETIYCDKCSNTMNLSDKGKYECKVCKKLTFDD